MPRPESEDGFVLITAVWLLLLCAAIVAVLMLRGNAASSETAGEERLLKQRLALDAATETVIADLLLRGTMSQWGNTPADGTVMIGEAPVAVTVTNEAGKLDLNAGDLGTIDLLLRELRYDAAERGRFTDLVSARRQSKRRIGSMVEGRALLAGLGPPAQASCLDELFTVYSAMEKPRPGQMPHRLASTMGDRARPQPIEPGAALRIQTAGPTGMQQSTVIRLVGLLAQPYAELDRRLGPACAVE